jgi:hypothetical protein
VRRASRTLMRLGCVGSLSPFRSNGVSRPARGPQRHRVWRPGISWLILTFGDEPLTNTWELIASRGRPAFSSHLLSEVAESATMVSRCDLEDSAATLEATGVRRSNAPEDYSSKSVEPMSRER